MRRYDRPVLRELLESAGDGNIVIYNYGFPLGNLTRQAQRLFFDSRAHLDLDLTERSIKRGIERADMVNRMSFLFSPVLLFPFLLLQRLFFRADLGDGYVATAVLLEATARGAR